MQVFGRVSQEQIVFGLAVLLCVGFAVSLPGFLTASNLLNLVRSVSILGILGVAMGLVVIGRGIDLSLVAVMAISVAWALQLATDGTPLPQAVAMGLAFSLVVGMINGFLIAYIELPAIFATLAMGTLVYGFGRYFLFGLDVIYLPDRARSLAWLGRVEELLDVDCIWYVRGKAAFLFEVEWTAMLGEPLLRRGARIPQEESMVRFLVIAPERTELVRHKIERSPLIREAMERDNWHVLKWNHARAFLDHDGADLADLEPYLGLDPLVERSGEQLPLFEQ